MLYFLSPFFLSPFTDITGGIHSHQMLGRCAQQEMALLDCLEAYGFGRGVKKCSYLIDDFRECQTHMKQFRRFYEMRRERDRQIAAKKLCGDKMYCSPVVDSY
ncbi:NADH dehydrogenase [ubiquinone] iron-sulfur protein 5 [Helicoverpa armigera]|uniref:NADH dehydrogenase [ubiquinone] iron-sulfur protein 5 n=1 Tax=Helicoverpa armigera TaxID=29058 RepID=UPI000B36DC24|nr:NADH dehydrogenase [ubiquinone] iron-sulfur protein 5 [Helicoverpa armigera]PZC83061.1 hypothetical protein B5X24_HaOG208534 [Helicoverpa armigera]